MSQQIQFIEYPQQMGGSIFQIFNVQDALFLFLIQTAVITRNNDS